MRLTKKLPFSKSGRRELGVILLLIPDFKAKNRNILLILVILPVQRPGF